jgi:hypothetical protein
MAARFPLVETRRRVRGFVLGLLADLPRKNCWSIAEHAGDRDPHGMQYDQDSPYVCSVCSRTGLSADSTASPIARRSGRLGSSGKGTVTP